MNIRWTETRKPPYPRAFTARMGDSVLFSVCERGVGHSDNRDRPYVRWCVFDSNVVDRYIPDGDIPIGLSDDEVKATALAIWRLHGGRAE